MKEIVVLLPGITGSRLVKDDKPVWDISAGAAGRALLTLGPASNSLRSMGRL
jgi:hypothetical protein